MSSLAFFAQQAWAIEYKLGTQAGLMQQPSSHYYLAVYGAYAQVGLDADPLFLRFSYFERPKFRHSGFVEQEQGGFLGLGHRLGKKKQSYYLTALLGAGAMQGYVKAEDPSSNYPERNYRIRGVSLAMEFNWQLSVLELSIAHQQFVGLASQRDIDAYVAWPYSFYYVRLGAAL